MANLMEHSTCVLDISDDEGKSQNASDGRGKENVPPVETVTLNQGDTVAAAITTSRKDMMTDEPRTPLGELNPKDFCPEGLDSTSCVVYEDEQCPTKEEAVESTPEVAEPTTTATTTELSQPSLLTTATVSSLIESTAPVVEAEQQQQQSAMNPAAVPLPTDSEIEIWESGSATEEAAAAEGNGPVESIFFP